MFYRDQFSLRLSIEQQAVLQIHTSFVLQFIQRVLSRSHILHQCQLLVRYDICNGFCHVLESTGEGSGTWQSEGTVKP